MDYEGFRDKVYALLPIGKVLQNPGKGETTIKAHHVDRLVYIRGKSPIYIDLRNIYAIYKEFGGRELSTTDLRTYQPAVFDSKKGGHSCNCTFLFLLLKELGVIDRISGSGRKNDPYYVRLPA